jgi:hypothetical protein
MKQWFVALTPGKRYAAMTVIALSLVALGAITAVGATERTKTVTQAEVTVPDSDLSPGEIADRRAATTPDPIVRTVTVEHTRTIVKRAHSPKPSPQPAAPLSYSGDGTKNVGTIEIPVDSVLHWKATGGLFAISNDADDDDQITVSSNGSSGETVVAAGTYRKVDIIASDSWNFEIVPQ